MPRAPVRPCPSNEKVIASEASLLTPEKKEFSAQRHDDFLCHFARKKKKVRKGTVGFSHFWAETLISAQRHSIANF